MFMFSRIEKPEESGFGTPMPQTTYHLWAADRIDRRMATCGRMRTQEHNAGARRRLEREWPVPSRPWPRTESSVHCRLLMRNLPGSRARPYFCRAMVKEFSKWMENLCDTSDLG